LLGALVAGTLVFGCGNSSRETENGDDSGSSSGGQSGSGAGAEGGAGDAGETGTGGTSGSDGGRSGAGGTSGASGGASGSSGTSGESGAAGSGDDDCGDGTVGDDECDDGNHESGDGCSESCQREDGWRCDLLQPTRCLEDCGDGLAIGAEARAGGCDDGNVRSGDGCSSTCRLEPGYTCPVQGRPCISSVDCGDGMLSGLEVCDDGNDEPDDGCAGDCLSVDPGFLCPIPNRECVPRCGDGIRTAGEPCDDHDVTSGDGCSATCRIEPGWSCTGTPSVCVQSVCGNGVTEAGESCDDGLNPATGRVNGLFTGDPMESARGCSKTCTREPSCRDATGTHACTTVCGDGNVDTGEPCDDGNRASGDGCSSTCTLEEGFTCTNMERPDSEPCTLSAGSQCLRLPVTYRDFDGQHLPSGHPDFFFLGATPSGGSRVTCVPNASGRPVGMNGSCWDSDATPLCTGIAAATLGANGKPSLGSTTSCVCRFTDWDNTGVLTGVAGTTTCTSGAATPTRLETMARVVQSAQSFAQWYADSALGTKVTGLLELRDLGTGTYGFSSSNGRTVFTDLHDIFMATAIPARSAQSPVFADAPANSLSSGFFPLEARTGAHASKLCNLWPYWPAALTTANCVAQDGNPVWQQWDPQGSFTARMAGTGGPVNPVNGVPRNFHFTSEVRLHFEYTGNLSLMFYGDDDVWVFVNGKLVLDLGAPHESLSGTLTLTGASAAWTIQAQPIVSGVPTTVTVDTGTVANLGLEVGRTYELVVFHADRHPRESNYMLSMTGLSSTRSECFSQCGDGVVTGAEECDDGPQNADGVYGGCGLQCLLGPFCGDGTPNGPEECDDGPLNGGPYGEQGACTAGCRAAHFCGDENVDLTYGEECDDGAANGSTECDTSCRLR
jgi:fibro-slime domain-containing protein